MKRILSIVLACLLVISLAGTVRADEAMYVFSSDFFARMDGSTSLVPLGQAIASVLLGIPREEAEGMIYFNRTTQSFRNLTEGYCDIVIAAEPKSEVFQEMREAAFPYLMETIAKEALVFVVNENNPVSNLTTQQLRDIYSGKITNWADVGGEDAPIEAFQRNATAGSQVMMEKLVMQGTPMMEAPTTNIPGEMAGLIEAVKSYDNSANAIGYTVFYYAADMQMAQGLKILRVDGVLPSVETIQSEEYPFLNGYYCCISANADAASPERKLFQWLVSAEGQKLLAMEGYVPVSSGEGDPGIVFTDYSGYVPTGRDAQKYTEFDCPHDHLEPSDRYGLIFPYKGPELYSGSESWDWSAGQMEGFYTHAGQRITDPVYTLISPLNFEDGDYFWVIGQGELQGMASKDGSIVTDICYVSIYTIGDQILCEHSYEDMTFDLYDRNMNLIKTEQDFTIGDGWLLPGEYMNGLYTGIVHQPGSDEYRSALMDEDGRVLMESEYYISMVDGFIRCYDDDWNVIVYDTDLNRMTFGDADTFQGFYALNDLFYYTATVDGTPLVVDKNGALFDWNLDDYTAYYENGSFALYRKDCMTVFNRKGRILFDNIPRDWSYSGGDIFGEETTDGLWLHKMTDNTSLFLPGATWCCPVGDFIACYGWSYDTYDVHLVDQNLQLVGVFSGDVNVISDLFNGEKYLLTYNSFGFAGESRLMTPDMKTELLRANGRITLQNGFFAVSDDWSFRCYNHEGELVFCYPYMGMGTGD